MFLIIFTSNVVFIVQDHTAFMPPTRNDKPIVKMLTNALPFDQWQCFSDYQGWILQRTSGFIQRFWQNRVVNVNKQLSTLQHKEIQELILSYLLDVIWRAGSSVILSKHRRTHHAVFNTFINWWWENTGKHYIVNYPWVSVFVETLGLVFSISSYSLKEMSGTGGVTPSL